MAAKRATGTSSTAMSARCVPANAWRNELSFRRRSMRREMLPVASHGYSYEGWARRCREFEQYLRVGRPASGLFEPGAVADGFSQIRKLVLEPPSERAEPEERGVEARKQLQIEVALTDMGSLVRKDNAELFGIPGFVVRRKYDRRSDGDWGRDGRAEQSRRPEACASVRLTRRAPSLMRNAKPRPNTSRKTITMATAA